MASHLQNFQSLFRNRQNHEGNSFSKSWSWANWWTCISIFTQYGAHVALILILQRVKQTNTTLKQFSSCGLALFMPNIVSVSLNICFCAPAFVKPFLAASRSFRVDLIATNCTQIYESLSHLRMSSQRKTSWTLALQMGVKPALRYNRSNGGISLVPCSPFSPQWHSELRGYGCRSQYLNIRRGWMPNYEMYPWLWHL